MMEACILASSSAGNAIAVRAARQVVLVDAGLSARAVETRLDEIGWPAAELAAILLTHEHRDHARGASLLAHRHRIPIYGTAGTLNALAGVWRGDEDLRPITNGRGFSIGDVACEPFSVPHDVADPTQYVLRSDDSAIGIATDLGRVTSLVLRKLSTVGLAIVEANHDADRLRWGTYPWELKQRIAGAHGHLDNDQAAEFVVHLAQAGVKHVVLAHLSPHHNDVDRVREVVAAALTQAGLALVVTVVGPREGTGIIACPPRS